METEAPKFRESELYLYLNESFPPIKRIEQILKEIEPRVISELIESEPETTFILDYYFRLFAPEIGARIISHPDLEIKSLIELYNCQVIRYYRVNLNREEYKADYASLLNSYWQNIEKNRLMELFKALITAGDSNRLSAMMILENMSSEDLRYLPEEQSESMLKFFKSLKEDFKNLVEDNLDIYDFVLGLAVDSGDADTLELLDGYTNLAVQMRIAQNFIEDSMKTLDSSGKVPFKTLVNLVNDAPAESLELTLQILTRNGMVEPGTIESLEKFQKEKNRG